MLHHTDYFIDQLPKVCTKAMQKSQGMAYLQILMQFPNCYLDCLRLSLMHNCPEQDSTELLESCLADLDYISFCNGNPALPIQITDIKTLKDIHQRFIKLRELEKLYRRNCDDARLQEVLAEIDQLNAFLEDTYGAKGIKTFLDEQHNKAFRAVDKALNYFLDNVKKRDENLYWQLKAHLHIGTQCAWIDD